MRTRLVAVLALLQAATTCQKDYIDEAAEAYDRQYWEKAFELYDRAKDRETDPKLVAMALERRSLCADRASAKYVEIARDHMTTRKYEDAIAAAEKARTFKVTPENTEILVQAKSGKALQLSIQARSHLELGEYDKASAAAEAAIALDPKPDYTNLLLEANRKKRESAAAAVAAAEEAFSRRQWAAAARAYARLGDAEARKRAEFAALMEEAERQLATDRASAVGKLREARRAGYHAEYITQLIDDATPADYEITVQDVAVLPFKPESMLPWDGTGGQVAGAADLLATLARLSGDSGEVLAKGRERILKMAPEGGAAPDCAVKATALGKNAESPVRTDEYAPTVNAVLALKEVVRRGRAEFVLEVKDRDEGAFETVGAWRIELADLLRAEGKRSFVFLDSDKKLRAGGIYGVTLSVRKIAR